MSRFQSDIDALAAPACDGDVLIFPDSAGQLRMAEANRALRAAWRATICNRPIQDWFSPPLSAGPLCFLSGHQPEFFHPGVWAKNAFAAPLAARASGEARLLLVDCDVPQHFALAWPERADGHWKKTWTTLVTAQSGLAFEQAPPLPSATWETGIRQLPKEFMNAPGGALRPFFDAFLAAESAGDRSYIARWSHALATLDTLVGLPPPNYLRISEMFSVRSERRHPGAAAFVAHAVLHAERFARAYNAALAEFRARRRIAGTRHPVPDLAIDADRIELPFWVMPPAAVRQRMYVSTKTPAAPVIFAGTRAVATLDSAMLLKDPAAALAAALGLAEVRPRALSLTMFARLLACDLFIHGIGGAKYDQITDDLIRRFFEIEPPRYACVSATLRLPLARHELMPGQAHALRRKLRDLAFNPQRLGRVADPALYEARRRAIAQADELRASQPKNRGARRNAFDRIRRANEAIAERMPDVADQIHRDLETHAARSASNEVADSRDWFVGLFALDPLRALVRKLSPA